MLFYHLIFYTLNLNVFGAYLYAKIKDIKQYNMQNPIVAIPNDIVGSCI